MTPTDLFVHNYFPKRQVLENQVDAIFSAKMKADLMPAPECQALIIKLWCGMYEGDILTEWGPVARHF